MNHLKIFCKNVLFNETNFHLKKPKLNQDLKLNQMDFLFEFLDIHMSYEGITYHDYHVFKWGKKKLNFYSSF